MLRNALSLPRSDYVQRRLWLTGLDIASDDGTLVVSFGLTESITPTFFELFRTTYTLGANPVQHKFNDGLFLPASAAVVPAIRIENSGGTTIFGQAQFIVGSVETGDPVLAASGTPLGLLLGILKG